MHDDMPTVSVIMNCLNCSRYLREAIDSVYAQTYTDWEIIFWDDASTDNSAEIAKSYDERLKYFKCDKTVALYAARNLALKEAKGKYIAFLDCDDIWLPQKLEEQIPLFEKDPKVGIVFSDSILFNEKGNKKLFFNIVKPEKGYVFSKLLICDFVHMPTVVVRKEAFDTLTYWFDSRFNMSGDHEAWIRISSKWKLDYVNKPLALYRVHSSNMTNTQGRKFLSHEIGLMIENLKKVVDNAEEKYSKEIKFLERRKDTHLSLLDWETGENKRARKRVCPHIRSSTTHMILYLLMYFPYRYVFKLSYRLYNRNLTA